MPRSAGNKIRAAKSFRPSRQVDGASFNKAQGHRARPLCRRQIPARRCRPRPLALERLQAPGAPRAASALNHPKIRTLFDAVKACRQPLVQQRKGLLRLYLVIEFGKADHIIAAETAVTVEQGFGKICVFINSAYNTRPAPVAAARKFGKNRVGLQRFYTGKTTSMCMPKYN